MTADVEIREETPLQHDVRALIAELNDAIDELDPDTPDEFKFRLTVDEMARQDTTTFVARRAGAALGCCALRQHPDGTAEIKRMFVRPAARGLGLGARLLDALERRARAEGLSRLALETGIGFAAARRIYERAGFEPCGPFAGYPDSGYAVFYMKNLRQDCDIASLSRSFDESRP